MTDEEILYRFMILFAGREDCHGSDTGACVRTPPPYAAHLYGNEPIGVYPLCSNGQASWGCIDIDEDNLVLAESIRFELMRLGCVPYIESSRSKGWHVWWFYGTPVPGWVPRGIGLMACEALGVTLEVNPKQFALFEDQVGNYVRLPYPYRHKKTRRQMIVESGERTTLIDLLQGVRFTPDNRLQALRSPLLPLDTALGIHIPEFMPDAFQGNTGGSRALWQEAARVVLTRLPVSLGHRDNQLYTAACLMWGLGWDEDRALLRMEEIWTDQLEQGQGRDFYPLPIALDKVRRTFRNRGGRKGLNPQLQPTRRKEPTFT